MAGAGIAGTNVDLNRGGTLSGTASSTSATMATLLNFLWARLAADSPFGCFSGWAFGWWERWFYCCLCGVGRAGGELADDFNNIVGVKLSAEVTDDFFWSGE